MRYISEHIELLEHKYHEISKASGLPTKIERLRIDGYKGVKIEQKYKDVTQE